MRSASVVTNGSDSLAGSPVPTAIVRTPLRFDCTGIACSASLIRIASEVCGVHACDLAEDSLGIEDRLALEHTVRRALVEQHAMTERVQVDVEDRGDQHALRDTGRVLAHVAQPAVLLLEHREALQLQVRETQPPRELEVLGAQPVAIGKRFAEPVPGPKRQVDDPSGPETRWP